MANVCVAITFTTSAGSVSATESPREAMPALATRMSTAPNAASASSASRSTSAGSDIEAWIAIAAVARGLATTSARPPRRGGS